MTIQETKDLINFCNEVNIPPQEVYDSILNNESDFENSDYRFIHEDSIDKIQVEELEADPYILGCFNADFIKNNSDLSYDIVKALQAGEQYEALGQHLIDNDCVEEMQQEYARLDGYGHHFARYDSYTMEDILHLGYFVFKTN